MDNFQRLRWQVRISILSILISTAALVAAFWAISRWYFGFSDIISLGIGFGAGIVLSFISVEVLTDLSLAPLKAIRQAFRHIDPHKHNEPAPVINKIPLGKEVASEITKQLYQYASQQDSAEQIQHRTEISQAANVVRHLPLPMFVFNKDLFVTNASDSAIAYCNTESAQLFGKPIFESLNLEFQQTDTLETWVQKCQDNKVTDINFWEHVRVVTADGKYRHCDLAAAYNRDNTGGVEYILTLFDKSAQYGRDDDAMSFISLAVHELRTPLTMLRGYIEVFEEEIGPQLNSELQGFMMKMKASSDLLSGFVKNILNVAKVENNQLSLKLIECAWTDMLKKGSEAMSLRARIHGMSIEYDIDPNIPPVAVDPITIQEVINNLLDNAIKYSSGSKDKRIIITSKLSEDGLVETTVRDFGSGIPANIMPHLFEKFYRNHRTRASVGGTGLGLFLCKAIIDAHEGKIWAHSKVDEGSIFGFTVLPYAKLKNDKKSPEGEIVRQANGWIKNHSFYRG